MKILQILSGFLFLQAAVSCDEEIQVISGGEQLPVVFGLFNPADTLTTIRLTKTFTGTESVKDLAQDPRNLYYEDAEVTLDINSKEGYPITSYRFERMEMPGRLPGLFTGSPNYLYCLKGPLDIFFSAGFQIRLLVRIPGINQIVSAQQTYYPPPVITSPKISLQTRLSFYWGEPPRIKWVDTYGFQKYILAIRFNYVNHFEDQSIPEYFDITYRKQSQVFTPDQESGTILHIFEGDDFLHKVGTGIPADPDIITRSFVSIDIIVTGLTKEYCDYEETNMIASDRQGRPVSNVVGGLGLFALRVKTEQDGYLLDPTSLDSLVRGRHTKQLKFVKW